MTSTTTDRFSGTPSGSDATPNAAAVRDGLAIKAPVKVTTTANITLSGQQTIDGVAVVSGDRVLVKDQTTTSENGIYECSTGAWSRTIDFDATNDIVEGTIICVNQGTLYADTIWRVNTASPAIGSALSITRASADITGYLTANGSATVTNKTIAGASNTLIVRLANDVTGTLLVANGGTGITNDVKTAAIIFIIDGGGAAITTGVKGDIEIPFACTVNSWTILADQSGSIVVDVWKDTYANFPPTVADTIAGSEKPTLTAAAKNQDASLSTWTTSITAGDILRFNVDSAATVTRVTIAIKVTRT